MGVAVGTLLGFALNGCASDALVAPEAFVWVAATRGLGVSLADADRGGKRLLRVAPGRVSVEGLAPGGRCDAGGTEGRCKPARLGGGVWMEAVGSLEVFGDALEAQLGVAKVAGAAVDTGTSAGSDPQSESTSSVLGADAAPSACDLLRGAA